LRCDFNFCGFAACLRARVTAITATAVSLLSDDGFSEVALPLGPTLTFRYTDARDFPEDAAFMARAVVVLFPPTQPGAEQDHIDFMELVEAKG
jgi:hypothetical protein